MKFDFQLFNWLWSLIAPKPATIAVPAAMSTIGVQHFSQTLMELAKKSGAPIEAMQKLIEYKNKNFPNKRLRYWAISDFTLHSANKRLFIFDTEEGTVDRYYVAHGKGSDPKFTGWCGKFSNEPGSLCSSKGIYLCAETYISGKFGYAMRMDGLEETNSNVRKRAVVFHGGKYAEDAYIKANHKTGRSEGCQAVGFQYSKDLINKLKNGSLLIVWSDK